MAYKINQFLPPITPGKGILLCGAISASLYAGALWFQYAGGLSPCNLCFWQRWPHIIIAMLAVLALFKRMHRLILTAIAITAATSVTLAAYHVGVEWQLWSGPGGCTASLINAGDLTSLTDSLLATPVVRCDEVAWSFLGLSMAGWNSLFSLDICLIALICLIQGKKAAS